MASVEAVAFSQALARGRERFNALFAQTNGRVDASRFGEHLRNVVAPVVEAVDRVRRDRVDAVVGTLYELSLDLAGSGIFDAHPAVAAGWRSILPEMPFLVAEQPRAAAAAVTNALSNLSAQSPAMAAAWVQEMTALSASCKDLATFRGAGHVVAWRCGMAQHRLGALQSCASLPIDMACRALGIHAVDTASFEQALRRLQDDPWLTPANALLPERAGEVRIVAIVSGFRGFGGVFLTPPVVFAAESDQLIARDDQHAWSIVADVFGSHLQPLPSIPHKRRGRAPLDLAHLPELANPLSNAANETTTAVTIPLSHSVFLVANQ